MMLRILKQYYPTRNIFFVIGEGLVIYSSVLLACLIVYSSESYVFKEWLWLKILLITGVCQTCLYYNELYDLTVVDNFKELSLRLLQSLGFAAIVLAGVYFIIPAAIIGRGIFIISIAFIILLIVSWRFLYKLILDRSFFDQKIILIGSGDLALNIYNEITSLKDSGYTITEVIPDCNGNAGFTDKTTSSVSCKNNYEGLCEIAKNKDIKKIVVALHERRGAFPSKELLKCRVDGIEIIEGNSFYEMLTGKLIVEHINPGWLIFSEGFKKSYIRRFIKYILDLILSVILLIILLPVIITTAILIKIDSKGPVIFFQERVGQKKKIYWIYKFRSMVTDAEEQSGPEWAKENDNRVTRVGKFIRKWRIDEIPQILNVIKGDMSFVGPRPEREYFVNKLEGVIPYYRERFTVKPGITGWAQVSYGYGASVTDAIQKLNFDLFYIKNLSTLMDLMIILRTVKTVLLSKGAR
ncbi:MAG: TIGR03013 family PEP-CTERM/XrtA system glycosyltransferase [Deltaproteobacteria bacterium]|nr:TIGR03013 family PEP-CTERM/XrtA system glycosyltransferase [Deltaproteobacteria bacterium]